MFDSIKNRVQHEHKYPFSLSLYEFFSRKAWVCESGARWMILSEFERHGKEVSKVKGQKYDRRLLSYVATWAWSGCQYSKTKKEKFQRKIENSIQKTKEKLKKFNFCMVSVLLKNCNIIKFYKENFTFLLFFRLLFLLLTISNSHIL